MSISITAAASVLAERKGICLSMSRYSWNLTSQINAGDSSLMNASASLLTLFVSRHKFS